MRVSTKIIVTYTEKSGEEHSKTLEVIDEMGKNLLVRSRGIKSRVPITKLVDDLVRLSREVLAG